MHVRVIIYVPPERVQHRRAADRISSAELRILQGCLQGERRRIEHRAVAHFLMRAHEAPQFGRDRECDEEVFTRQ